MNLKSMLGIGVAGNVTGHLEQAGETRFISQKIPKAPRGIFPFYCPNCLGSFLSEYPLSQRYIKRPPGKNNVQIESEVALICDVAYSKGKVKSLKPTHFTAFNDCSIRKPGKAKLSTRKNWGPSCHGISHHFIEIDKFRKGGILDHYRIVCFLRRSGKLHAYGKDSSASGYLYFYKDLLDWVVKKMNGQRTKDGLEPILPYIKEAHYPKQAIIAVGATIYTKFGEKTYLKPGDELYVVVYNSNYYSPTDIRVMAEQNKKSRKGCSILHQVVK